MKEAMKRFANRLVENEFSDRPVKLEDLATEFEISRKTSWQWRNTPEFIEYVQILSQQELQKAHLLMAKVLIKNLQKSQPSTKMMDLMAKMTPNMLNPKEVVIEDKAQSKEVSQRIKELKKVLGDAHGK